MRIPILALVVLSLSGVMPANDRQRDKQQTAAQANKGAQVASPRNGIPAVVKATNGVVVSIVMLAEDGRAVSQGSGFFVSKDGRIVTNYHVIEKGSSAIAKLPGGALFVVDGLLTFDKARDIAVIKAHGEALRTATLGNSDQLRVGEQVVAVGNPLDSTVSSGVVSGIPTGARGNAEFLQITAPISADSSGGPLLNMAGEVVGITTSYLEVAENLSFAIPINDVKPLLQNATSKLTGFPVVETKQKDASPVPPASSAASDSARQTFSASSENVVSVFITSDPEGADVYVDDSMAGKSPLRLKLAPGAHTIRMFMSDYQNWIEWITVETGPELHITATLQKRT